MSIGVPKIKVPVLPQELTQSVMEEYLVEAYKTFEQQAATIRKNYDIYLGKHAILDKKRAYNSESAINNRVVEQHLRSLVDFKCGYLLGNPKEYAHMDEADDDDVHYLHKYLTDCNIRSVDDEVTKWAYATGVGYYFVQSKDDANIDPTGESAPFVVLHLDSDCCFKVYSAYPTCEKPELFDVLVTEIKEKQQTVKILSVYTPSAYYSYTYSNGTLKQREAPVARLVYNYLPLVAKYPNTDGVGLVEAQVSLQDALDKITSNQLDNIQELVNAVYVFINADLGSTPEEMGENFTNMRKNGVISIPQASPEAKPSVDVLKQELNQKDTALIYSGIKQTLYDTSGVPLASSSVTSGGDTGEARQLGNGWENAYTIILREINCLIRADYAVLERILYICSNVANAKINHLRHNAINIKYKINRSDNLLVKSQSYDNLVANGVPPTIALELCELTSDPDTLGRKIEEYARKQAALSTAATTGLDSSRETV